MLRHDRRPQLRHVGVAAAAAGPARNVRAAQLLRAGPRGRVLSQPRACQRLSMSRSTAQPHLQICTGKMVLPTKLRLRNLSLKRACRQLII